MSRLAVLVPSVLVVLATPAFAVFHASHISELMSGAGADPTVQYVEISMDTTFQNAVANTRLTAFNCDGSSHQVLMVVPGNVANQGPGVTWIMASQSFAAASGITPDFTWNTTTDGNIDPTCGMVCWGAPGIVPPSPGTWSETDPNQYVDCVAYGGYTGTTKTSDPDPDGVTSSSGTPTGLLPGDGSKSLTRISSTNDNLTDFALVCPPTPTNNGDMQGVVGCTTTTSTSTSTSTTTTTTLPGKSKCTGKELSAAGKKALAKAKCHSKAVTKGEPLPPDSPCLATAESKFTSAYGKAVDVGDCRTTTDAMTVENKVNGFISDLDTTLVNGSTAASKCTGKELAAAGKKASAKLKCHSKAVAKNDTTKLTDCLGAAETKFSSAYGKAIAAGDCINSTDAGTVEGKVNTFVDDVKGTLAP
jgi:hypothetical protein